MTASLVGSVIVVTGGSAGIGAGIVERLVGDGATVVVGVETETIADEVRSRWAETGAIDAADVVAADLRDRAACRALIDGCVERHGQIDALVNNAAVTGAAARGAFLDYTDEAFDHLMDVNVGAAFRCGQRAARHMVGQGDGVIVNIGSVGGFVAQYTGSAYSTSKSALLGLTRGMALELGEHGVRAVYVAPGDIDTGLAPSDYAASHPYERTTPYRRRGSPADVAGVVSFLCSPDAEFVSGTSWAVDGGWLSY